MNASNFSSDRKIAVRYYGFAGRSPLRSLGESVVLNLRFHLNSDDIHPKQHNLGHNMEEGVMVEVPPVAVTVDPRQDRQATEEQAAVMGEAGVTVEEGEATVMEDLESEEVSGMEEDLAGLAVLEDLAILSHL